ncbi:MAG: division/cell wall cluster transcriptional repressor MraZ [Bacillota bacterium]|jgi:MraZ protein
MFMGEFQHSIDEKSRIIIPARFRADLGTSFVLTKGLDKCLFVYPMEEWKRVATNLKQLSSTRADARSFARIFFSGAVETTMDKQGRALLPANLRKYASLDKDIVIIGVSSRMEIWDKEIWEQYSEQANDQYEEVAEKLADLDLDISF